MAASHSGSAEAQDDDRRDLLARAYVGQDEHLSQIRAATAFERAEVDLPIRLPDDTLLLSVETRRFEGTRIISKERVLQPITDCANCGHEYGVKTYSTNGVESAGSVVCHACDNVVEEWSTV